MDSDYEEVLSEQFDTFVSDNSPSKMGAYNINQNMKIKKLDNKRALTMGKKAIVLDTALTQDEKAALQKQIKDFTNEI